MTSELKPCPFCGIGSELAVIGDDECGWYVECFNCYATGGDAGTRDKAVRLWNTRAERTCRMKPVYASNALECSECSSYVATWDAECDVCGINYCPNCGAKVVNE